MTLILTAQLRVALSGLMAQLQSEPDSETIAIALSDDGYGAIMLNGIPAFHLRFEGDAIEISSANVGISVRPITAES